MKAHIHTPPTKTQLSSLIILSGLITLFISLVQNSELDSCTHVSIYPAFKLETEQQLYQQALIEEEKERPSSVTIQPGQVLSEIFFDQGIPNNTLYSMLDKVPTADKKKLSNLKPGQSIEFIYDKEQNLEKMILEASPIERLTVDFSGSDFKTSTEKIELISVDKNVHFEIGSSLYQAAVDMRIGPSIVKQISDVFAQQIDLSREARIGDHFDIIFTETRSANGDIQNNRLKDVIYYSQAKRNSFRATYLENQGFFSSTGQCFGKDLIERPLEYTHISSHFNLERMHPILKIKRPHRGVDFAAKEGTPVWSIGQGKVSFVGNRGGYGKTIIIKHDNKNKTLYAHLSDFAKDLKVGQTVTAKQIIGYVGQSGLATAPHLHFEFHVDNIAIDPLKRPEPAARELTGEDLVNLQVMQEQWDLLRQQQNYL